MSKFAIFCKKINKPHAQAKRWCLDFPNDEQEYTASELLGTSVTFSGWVICHNAKKVQIELRQGDTSSLFTLDVRRPDVVAAILQEEAADHPQLYCGFSFQAPLSEQHFSIWLNDEGHSELLWEGSVKPKQSVITGTHGWLYLDNDTNQSVEQFQGRLLLSAAALNDWANYFHQLEAITSEKHIPYSLVIAPTKEAVYEDFYPYKRAEITPIEQLLNENQGFPIVYPRLLLKTDDPYSFLRTDTHWSTHGAKSAVLATLERLGLDQQRLFKLFEQDAYRRAFRVGDLGMKFFPSVGAYEWAPANFSLNAALVYENAMPNFGRVMLFNKPDALYQARCLIFGSSSSYSMLNYFYRVFKEIVFVHSAGNVDASWIQELRPDYLICQTNERFVIKSPQVGYSVKQIIAEKLEQLDELQISELTKKQQAFLAKPTPVWINDVIARCK